MEKIMSFDIKSDEITNTVYITYDLTKFKLLKLNRDINETNKNKIKKAILLNGNLIKDNPILVDKDGNVVDGQHRLKAISEINNDPKNDVEEPIAYMIQQNDSSTLMQDLNSISRNWTLNDWKEYYVCKNRETGAYKPYVEYKRLQELYPFKDNALCLILEADRTKIRTGELKFKTTAKIQKDLDRCHDLYNAGFIKLTFNQIPTALKQIFRTKGYNHKRMITVIQRECENNNEINMPKESIELTVVRLKMLYNKHLAKANNIK
jgi:hypothetical protein